MSYAKFDGELDAPSGNAAGFTPFTGELDGEPPKKRTWGQAAADTGVQLAEGVNTIAGAVPSLVAPDSGVAGFFRDNAESWRAKQSDILQGRANAASAAIDKAGEDGVIAQVLEAAKQYSSDPALAARFVTTNLPSMIPGIGAAKLAQAAALARGASAVGAASLATTAAGGVNSVLNAGGARGEAFEDIKKTLESQGRSPEEATQIALDKSRLPAAIGGVTGFISGKTGLEGALTGKLSGKVAAAASELAGEQLEEVAPKLATNYQASEYDNRGIGKDVGRTIVETAIGSGPGAIYSGIVSKPQPKTPQQAVADIANAPDVDSAIKAAEEAVNAGPKVDDFISNLAAMRQQVRTDEFRQALRESQGVDIGQFQTAVSVAANPVLPMATRQRAMQFVTDSIAQIQKSEAQDVGTVAPANPVDSGIGGQLGGNAAGGDTVRGRVADNAGQRGTDAAGTVLGDGQQNAPLRTGEPTQPGALNEVPTRNNTATDLKARRDAFVDESELVGGSLPAGTEIHDPLFTALRRITLGAEQDGRIESIKWAIANGRHDIADMLVAQSANEAVNAEKAQPGVDQSSPKYESIKAALKDRASETSNNAESLARLAKLQEEDHPRNVQNATPGTQAEAQAAPSEAPASAGTAASAEAVPAAPGNAPVEAAGVAQSIHYGINHIPMTEGGKAFKTEKAAKDAKKLQTMMRVKKVKGGYILTEKTPAQVAAQAKAAARLAAGTTGDAGIPQHAHGFMAREGGLSKSTMKDLGFDKNQRVGSLWMFKADGGMSLEQATEKLIEGGYLKEGASHSDAIDLIKKSVTNPQYTADGWDRIAQAEADARFEDHLAAQEESAQNEDFDPFASSLDEGFDLSDIDGVGYDEASDPIKLEVNALLAQAQSLGIDTESIRENEYENTKNGSEQDYFEAFRRALASAIEAGNRDSSPDSGEQGNAAGENPNVRSGVESPGEAVAQSSGKSLEAGQKDIDLAKSLTYKLPYLEQRLVEGLDPTDGFDMHILANSLPESIAYNRMMMAHNGDFQGIEFKKEDSERYAFVLPDASNPGSWRVSYFDKNGFSRHESEPTREKAQQTLAIDGFTVEDKGALDRFAETKEWAIGTAFGDLIMQLNKGMITHAQFLDLQQKLNSDVDAQKQDSSDNFLVSPSREDILDRQQAEQDAAKAKEKADKEQEEKDRAERIQKEIDARQRASAENFILGQNAEDALAGQGDVFNQPESDAETMSTSAPDKRSSLSNQVKKDAEPAAQATAILDAAEVKGKERIDVLKDVKSGTITPEEVQAAYPAKEPAKPAIADFGEKIGGAKKDVWTGFKDKLNEVSDDEIASKKLSEVWPAPDYQALIDGGMDSVAVANIRTLRDEVPSKPRSAWKVSRWAEQVKELRGLANALMDGRMTGDQFKNEFSRAGSRAQGILGRSELYQEVGHGKSLEGIRLTHHFYNIYRGKENVSLWVVEQDAAATAFSNWPRELATGDTKQDAIDAFKARYSELDSLAAVKKSSFDIVSRDGNYWVAKKIGRNHADMAGPFATVKEARDYRASNLPELEAKLEKYKQIPRERRDVNDPRVGEDMRNGQDVTPEFFAQTFGFRGVEFGNWVEQKRRQKDLNDAFDGLMDMAAVLGIPARAISLNGQLGLAFGARGSGGVNPAAAHYESDKMVINLTKKEGAGSLGHEWWHAVDNYFSKMRGKNEYMTTALDVSLASRDASYFPNPGVRKEMIDAFGAVVKAIRNTSIKMRSQNLDDKRGKAYWTTGEEMTARAFESYLIAKLQDQDASNDYLANVVDQKVWDAMAALGIENENSYPYPTADEIPAIRAGFDKFFDTVQTKETDVGVAMFARGDGMDAFRASLSKLSEPPPATDPKVIAQVQAWTDELSAKWENGPSIRVVSSFNDLPVPSTSDTRGLYYRGTVYVVAGRVGSKRAVGEVLAHESVAHYGLREMLGQDDWTRFMGNVQMAIKSGNKPLNAIRDQIRSVYVDENGKPNLTPDEEADEIAARVVEKAIDANGEFKPGFAFAKSVYAKIAQFLRDMGLNVQMTHLELQGALINAQRYLEAGNRTEGGGQMVVAAAREDAQAARGTNAPVTNPNDVVGNQGGRSADDSIPGALVVATDKTSSVAVSRLNKVLRDAGWEVEYIDIDLTAEKPKATIRVNRDDGRYLIAKVDAIGRANFETFQRERNLGMNASTRGRRPLTPLVDDTFLGRHKFEGARSMLRGMTHYLTDNASTPINLADMRSAWAGVMNAPIKQEGIALLPNEPTAPDSFGAPMAARSPIQSNTWNSPSTSKFDNIVYTLQNKQIDTKRVVEAIKQAGKDVAESVDVYLREELFHGRSAKRTEDFLNNELTPLLNDMKARGISLEQIDKYLHARHAEEANKVIASRNPDMPDGGSGMKTQEAKDYLNSIGAAERNRLDAVAKKIDGMIATTRQLYADEGLESQETVDSWGAMFKHYVPLMREDKDGGMGIGQGFSIKGKESKGRVGSSRAVVDILANIAMQREKVIVRGEKNRVATALVGLATENPNPDFWTVGETPHEKVYDPKTNSVVDRIDPMYKSRENVVVAKVKQPDGNINEVAVVFNEDNDRAVRMAASLKNLDALQLNGLLGLSAKISRYISSINTQYNPIFGIVNLARDVQGAMVNLSTTELKGQQKEVSKHVLSALKGVYLDARAVREGKTASSKWAALNEEFQNLGGQTGYRDLFATSEDRAKALQNELMPYAWMDGTLGKIFTANGSLKVPMSVAQDKAKGLFDWLSDYNLAMENAVRLSAFKVGIDQGMSKERAASLAKNLTVNFNRKGQISQQAGALYAFFNAGVQGTARLSQVLFEMDGTDPRTIRLSATGKKVVAGGIMLGVAQAVMLAAAGFGDDDPPEFVRERNLIIPTGWTGATGDKAYITIPMPLGLHVLPNIGRVSTEFALGGFRDPVKRAAKLFGLFTDAFNPMGGGASLLQILSPTPIDPLVALAENKDGMGRTIAKTSRNPAVPGFTLAKDTASKPAKMIAEAINYLSGGTEYKAGVLSPTPDQVDFLIGQATGGVGREISKGLQTASAVYTGEELPTHKIPLVGRFYGDSDLQSAQSNAFYSAVKRIEEHELEIKGLRKDGKSAELAEYMSENPEARLVPMANRVEIQIQNLQKRKRELMKRDADAAQIKAVENQITERMKVFNMVVRNLREKQPA